MADSLFADDSTTYDKIIHIAGNDLVDSASEQTGFRHTVAMKLDHAKICDLIVEAVEKLTREKG